MAHHTTSEPLDPRAIVNDLYAREESRSLDDILHERFGTTVTFSEGPFTSPHEQETEFRVVPVKGKVVIDFGHPVRSVGLTPAQARRLANSLLNQAAVALEG